MRCLACGCILTDYESTRKYADANLGYVDLCERDFRPIKSSIHVRDRRDLKYQQYRVKEEDGNVS